ncbi:MAG: type II toxin-antitoxin system RelE family toxin [Propylenella sp.]
MTRISYSRAALRTLMRMPRNIARLIRSKIEQCAADPTSLANNVKSLKGEPRYFRLRVGDWRVVFGEGKDEIRVIRIAPRGSAYD